MEVKKLKEKILDYFTERYGECTVEEFKEFSKLLDDLITKVQLEEYNKVSTSYAAHRLV